MEESEEIRNAGDKELVRPPLNENEGFGIKVTRISATPASCTVLLFLSPPACPAETAIRRKRREVRASATNNVKRKKKGKYDPPVTSEGAPLNERNLSLSAVAL